MAGHARRGSERYREREPQADGAEGGATKEARMMRRAEDGRT